MFHLFVRFVSAGKEQRPGILGLEAEKKRGTAADGQGEERLFLCRRCQSPLATNLKQEAGDGYLRRLDCGASNLLAIIAEIVAWRLSTNRR
jgi:hypothetical protein